MSSYGVLSFGDEPILSFPITLSYPLIAPYWTDIDLSGGAGSVRYTVYTTENGASYIDQVNKFLVNRTANSFVASMLLVVQWIDVVCPDGDYYNDRCSEVIN